MALPNRKLATWSDLQRTPDDGNMYEVLDGELVMTPAPYLVHQDVSRQITKLVGRHIDDNDLGTYWYAPTAVRLSKHDVPEPDFLFVRKDRLGECRSREAIHGPPDLVVEILSESTFRKDLLRKRRIYERYGVLEYWIVDPAKETVTVLTLEELAYRDSKPVRGEDLIRSKVLPALKVRAGELFG